MTRKRPTVLILASDPAFSREITAHWPHDPAPQSNRPEFIVLDQGSSRDLKASNYDLAIADASYYERRKHNKHNKKDETDPSKNKDKDQDKDKDKNNDRNNPNQLLNQSLAAAGKPAILIHGDPARDFYNIHGAVIELRREPGVWPTMAGLIGREILRRRQAESHAREAEKTCAAAQSEATLGRYMLEMRTNVNNALTTVLGNAELLVLEPGLPATVLAQADTIRNMALRLHEVFQRFSSLEKELTVEARESGKKSLHAAAGSS
ncbi:MAG TPA: hypothetical protein VK302_00765 [Terriglobales bacterium]|nr:hypothetical protein [Terriglobales bacterium]